jgi:hypothetical protein
VHDADHEAFHSRRAKSVDASPEEPHPLHHQGCLHSGVRRTGEFALLGAIFSTGRLWTDRIKRRKHAPMSGRTTEKTMTDSKARIVADLAIAFALEASVGEDEESGWGGA